MYIGQQESRKSKRKRKRKRCFAPVLASFLTLFSAESVMAESSDKSPGSDNRNFLVQISASKSYQSFRETEKANRELEGLINQFLAGLDRLTWEDKFSGLVSGSVGYVYHNYQVGDLRIPLSIVASAGYSRGSIRLNQSNLTRTDQAGVGDVDIKQTYSNFQFGLTPQAGIHLHDNLVLEMGLGPIYTIIDGKTEGLVEIPDLIGMLPVSSETHSRGFGFTINGILRYHPINKGYYVSLFSGQDFNTPPGKLNAYDPLNDVQIDDEWDESLSAKYIGISIGHYWNWKS